MLLELTPHDDIVNGFEESRV